jgi:acyl-coenzyme A synthetase/AMP-(fatty) acid ligase
MFSPGSSFRLIEQEQLFTADHFASQHKVLADNYIELDGEKENQKGQIVANMLQAISHGSAASIPVIFNRSSQTFDHSEIPDEFCIGLFTSGTTGPPKLVFHSLDKLLPENRKNKDTISRWLLCYHPMSYAGLQVILQAVVANDTLVTDTAANMQQKAQLALKHKINAISATPSLMRGMLLCWCDDSPLLELITLGGEISDQATLDALKKRFPHAVIRHIYATTETGVIFSVKDGREGFPKQWLNKTFNGWQITLRDTLVLTNHEHEIETGDCIEIKHDRAVFSGRKDSVVNVGGVKVDLEAIERQLIALEEVTDARVYVKANPITGVLVCAEICIVNGNLAKQAVAHSCQQLEAAARPRITTFCKQLTLNQAGKKQRCL